jgi:hypothetical protein
VKHRHAALLALLVTTSVLAVAAARERSIAEREAAAADAAAARSDWLDAVGHARAAAEAMVPGSPWPDEGFRRLDATGHDAEARGDLETALLAYGAMRTASLATRSILPRNDAWRARAEGGLARVAAVHPEVTGPRITPQSMLDALEEAGAPAQATLAAWSACAFAALAGLAWLLA